MAGDATESALNAWRQTIRPEPSSEATRQEQSEDGKPGMVGAERHGGTERGERNGPQRFSLGRGSSLQIEVVPPLVVFKPNT